MFKVNPQFKDYEGEHTVDGMLSVCKVLTRQMYDGGIETAHYFDNLGNIVIESLANDYMPYCRKLIKDGVITESGRRKSFFDGYNNIFIRKECGKFSLVEYVRDKFYSGDGRVYCVRLGTCGEDLANFADMERATRFYDLCQRVYREHADSKPFSDILDIIIKEADGDDRI